MIARLTGIVAESGFSGCVLDVHGVGYEVAIPVSTFEKLPQPGGEARLFIHTQVREDAIQLFGFATVEEKNLFRQLLNVSGIGQCGNYYNNRFAGRCRLYNSLYT